MNHIQFFNAQNVCERPKLLGKEVIVVDYSEELCKSCMKLIMDYNARMSNYELALSIPKPRVTMPPTDDPSTLVRGFLIGMAFATIFCISFFMMWRLVWGQ